eukprot:1387966-Rhodomonas_salina.1
MFLWLSVIAELVGVAEEDVSITEVSETATGSEVGSGGGGGGVFRKRERDGGCIEADGGGGGGDADLSTAAFDRAGGERKA